MARTGLASPSPPNKPPGLAGKVRSVFGAAGDRASLAAHRLADRFDLVPPEFGRERPVDESDARSVRSEWLRYLRLWSAYNPEEIFALKVGSVLLGAAIVAMWLAIAIIL